MRANFEAARNRAKECWNTVPLAELVQPVDRFLRDVGVVERRVPLDEAGDQQSLVDEDSTGPASPAGVLGSAKTASATIFRGNAELLRK